MTNIAYGIATPTLRGLLQPPRFPLDIVTGVTITGAWGLNRPLLSSFAGQALGRVRDTVTAGYADFAGPGDAVAFLGGDAGAVVSAYDHSSNGRTLTNGTAVQQPAFNADVDGSGKAGMTFDAVDDNIGGPSLPSLLGAGYATFYTIGVASYAVLDNNKQLWLQSTGYVGVYMQSGMLAFYIYDTSVHMAQSALLTAGQLFVWEAWRDAGVHYLRINGGTTYSATAGTPGDTGGTLNVGANPKQAMNGSQLELVFMSARPTQADDLVADMKSYYGIT